MGTCRGVWITARQQRLASACFLSAEGAAQRNENKGHTWEHFHKRPCHVSAGGQGHAILGCSERKGEWDTSSLHRLRGPRGAPPPVPHWEKNAPSPESGVSEKKRKNA